jgi:hypothetical protein
MFWRLVDCAREVGFLETWKLWRQKAFVLPTDFWVRLPDSAWGDRPKPNDSAALPAETPDLAITPFESRDQ